MKIFACSADQGAGKNRCAIPVLHGLAGQWPAMEHFSDIIGNLAALQATRIRQIGLLLRFGLWRAILSAVVKIG